jgi:putative transposase
VTCRVLGFTKQAYYAWRKQPVSQRDWDDAHLINAAYDIHADDPAFGYRFIADELREQGIATGENRVAQLCSQQRIWSVFAKKPGLTRKAGPPVHDDLVDRVFTAAAPNVTWLTDITEHRTAEGKLYLCVIKDVYSGRIVGYSIDSRMKASLGVVALRKRSSVEIRSALWSIPTAAVSSARTPSSARSRTTAWSGRWAGSAPAGTTPRWSPSSHCCRRTSSTGSAGTPARNYVWRSSPGSSGPTTAGAVNAGWDGSRRSDTRHSPAPRQRPNPNPTSQPNRGQSPPRTGAVQPSLPTTGPNVNDVAGHL